MMKRTSEYYRIMRDRIRIVNLSDGTYTFDIDGITTSNTFKDRMDAVKWSVWSYKTGFESKPCLKVVR